MKELTVGCGLGYNYLQADLACPKCGKTESRYIQGGHEDITPKIEIDCCGGFSLPGKLVFKVKDLPKFTKVVVINNKTMKEEHIYTESNKSVALQETYNQMSEDKQKKVLQGKLSIKVIR